MGMRGGSEGFDFIKFALHNQHNYQLTVWPDSSYSSDVQLSCN